MATASNTSSSPIQAQNSPRGRQSRRSSAARGMPSSPAPSDASPRVVCPFLHDHSKCADAQRATAASEVNFWDTVLPGHDSRELIMEQSKSDADNCCPRLEELSMSEFSDWFECVSKSPPSSPVHRDCPLPSHYASEFELVLRGDDYGDV